MFSDWALGGECERNPGYMLESCALSCEQCDPTAVETLSGEVGGLKGNASEATVTVRVQSRL